MHPFCCGSSPPDGRQIGLPPQPATLTELLSLPPPPSSCGSLPVGDSSSRRSHDENGNGVRRSATLESLCKMAAMRDGEMVMVDQHGISGILYKWVNYGRGWRPRWFVLKDGVLSYYKIHGPNKIIVNLETEKGSKVIGEVPVRRMAMSRQGCAQSCKRNPIGEIHLKVSSVRESKSDDRRFSIFTGTKRVHLRAESREDRLMWMEALQTVKEMFPRISNSELMAPVENVVVSTEKLRQRLEEEGLSETVIQDVEQIMRTEFSALHSHLVVLKQKQMLLVDILRQLEVFKTKQTKGKTLRFERLLL